MFCERIIGRSFKDGIFLFDDLIRPYCLREL